MKVDDSNLQHSKDIAIIGMSCRFPGSNAPDEFWNNLCNGIESIRRFTKEELSAGGINKDLINDPKYVPVRGIIEGIDKFDANFFGYNATDATMTDPQQRLFLECSWEALENAGYVPEKYRGLIAVYASMADSLYLQNNLLKNKNFLQSFDWFQTRIATSVTTLSTQLSYRLNLKGPSVNITTACSSSLVAVATACNGLVNYDCDMAIAGAAHVITPQIDGYLYQEGGIESIDGHCKAFDAEATGTIFSNGVGVVILKRLEDAIKDNDFIYAVIKGWSVNNDGADKVGFSAPSVNGQAKCIASALAFAELTPDSIGYLEAHGTGTALGDPIEVKALTKAFKLHTDNKQYCAIGTVKTNFGHLDIASGMASLIKTCLILKNKIIPPILHYKSPNPEIDFPNTPFYVNDKLKKWDSKIARRAGINASGIGGTNAFLVLEEYNKPNTNNGDKPYELLVISAKTKSALETASNNLVSFLKKTTEDFSNIAYTLQVGRADFNFRRILVCSDTKDALSQLKSLPNEFVLTRHQKTNKSPKIVFMFSGQGSQYAGMAKELYLLVPEFKTLIDTCCKYLDSSLKQKVYTYLITTNENIKEAEDTAVIQPALFIIEYSLAKLFINIGVNPGAMIGHSIGEYVAACLSGVINLEDAVRLVCQRGKLMSQTSEGSMLAIQLNEEEVKLIIENKSLSLAAINSPTSCVVSGGVEEITKLENILNQNQIMNRRVKIAYGFHSHLMDVVLSSFRGAVSAIKLKEPYIPFISNVTGKWIDSEEATDPSYWERHLRSTVNFLGGVNTLINSEYDTFIEIGPGRTLKNFADEIIKNKVDSCILRVMPNIREKIDAYYCLLKALGSLWLHGVKIIWSSFYQHEDRRRIPLPTYPFEKKSYWIKPDPLNEKDLATQIQPYSNWFYEPTWVRKSLQTIDSISSCFLEHQQAWVIFGDNDELGDSFIEALKSHNQLAFRVKSGNSFQILGNNEYVISLSNKEDYLKLTDEIIKITRLPLNIINFFVLTKPHDLTLFDLNEIENTINQGFYSTLFFSQALIEKQFSECIKILILGNEIFSVLGNEDIYPAKSSVIGPCRVIPQEHPNFKIQIVDIELAECRDGFKRSILSKQLLISFFSEFADNKNYIKSYRGDFCWIQQFQAIPLTTSSSLSFPAKGVYLLTGGLGGISTTISKYIAQNSNNPHFILLTRSDFPEQKEWSSWLAQNSKENSISLKILRLQEIISLGGTITILQVDIANLEQATECFNKIKNEIGAINGVIHSAGVPGGGLAQLKTPLMADKVFSPKIQGTYILFHLFRNEPLDFFLLCSSVSSILGELSQIDYCSANACLDAFANSKILHKNKLLTSINWNTWREVGMAVETDRPADVTYFDRNNDISPEEGVKIFADIIRNHYKQVIISTLNLETFIELINTNKEDTNQVSLSHREDILDEDHGYSEPKNNYERDLTEIWQNILGIDRIGTNDDFFELGGHSLMALRLISKIEQKFHTKITLQLLQDEKTIKNLAVKLKDRAVNTSSHNSIIIPMRLQGIHPPLFCIHPVAGTIFCYQKLVKYLKYDCPIYALQDPSLENEKLLFSSMEEMASCYVGAIKQVQKLGPYYLSGLSFGATLAFEIARQLRAKGDEVKPIIFFDGWAKFSTQQHIEELFKNAILSLESRATLGTKFVDLCWERMKLLLSYEIPKMKYDAILFKAKDLLPEYKEIDQAYNYWDRYISGNIEVHIIPGDHESIMEEPNITALADKLHHVLATLLKEERHEADVSKFSDFT